LLHILGWLAHRMPPSFLMSAQNQVIVTGALPPPLDTVVTFWTLVVKSQHLPVRFWRPAITAGASPRRSPRALGARRSRPCAISTAASPIGRPQARSRHVPTELGDHLAEDTGSTMVGAVALRRPGRFRRSVLGPESDRRCQLVERDRYPLFRWRVHSQLVWNPSAGPTLMSEAGRGRVRRRDFLGGALHEYRRAA